MNSYSAVLNVSKAIVDLIWNSIKEETDVNSIIATKKQICLAAPKEPESLEDKKLFIFLYSITESPSLRNQPIPQTEQGITSPPALFLALHYLITPYTNNSESDQKLLGKVMQIFAETPILPKPIPQGKLVGNGTELRLVMDKLSIEDLNKLWIILHTPYRLSVSYTVAPVRVETTFEKKPKDIRIR